MTTATAVVIPTGYAVQWGRNLRAARLSAPVTAAERAAREQTITSDNVEVRTRQMARPLTQAELAARLGIAQNTISRLEHGLHCPSDPVKIALANEFRVGVESLFPYPRVEAP